MNHELVKLADRAGVKVWDWKHHHLSFRVDEHHSEQAIRRQIARASLDIALCLNGQTPLLPDGQRRFPIDICIDEQGVRWYLFDPISVPQFVYTLEELKELNMAKQKQVTLSGGEAYSINDEVLVRRDGTTERVTILKFNISGTRFRGIVDASGVGEPNINWYPVKAITGRAPTIARPPFPHMIEALRDAEPDGTEDEWAIERRYGVAVGEDWLAARSSFVPETIDELTARLDAEAEQIEREVARFGPYIGQELPDGSVVSDFDDELTEIVVTLTDRSGIDFTRRLTRPEYEAIRNGEDDPDDDEEEQELNRLEAEERKQVAALLESLGVFTRSILNTKDMHWWKFVPVGDPIDVMEKLRGHVYATKRRGKHIHFNYLVKAENCPIPIGSLATVGSSTVKVIDFDGIYCLTEVEGTGRYNYWAASVLKPLADDAEQSSGDEQVRARYETEIKRLERELEKTQKALRAEQNKMPAFNELHALKRENAELKEQLVAGTRSASTAVAPAQEFKRLLQDLGSTANATGNRRIIDEQDAEIQAYINDGWQLMPALCGPLPGSDNVQVVALVRVGSSRPAAPGARKSISRIRTVFPDEAEQSSDGVHAADPPHRKSLQDQILEMDMQAWAAGSKAHDAARKRFQAMYPPRKYTSFEVLGDGEGSPAPSEIRWGGISTIPGTATVVHKTEDESPDTAAASDSISEEEPTDAQE